ncbi:MAG: hypothetical protein GY862_04335 [Gammaproteobacteria bacterium]|nr:hypothetical protein [Gammaproteobacteria bacterium]
MISINTKRGCSRAGNIEIDAQQALVVRNADINSFTAGRGDGGAIIINAGWLKVFDNGKITADADETGRGGNLKLRAYRIDLSEGGAVSAVGRGESEAGNIELRAENVLRMRNGFVKTETESADGGDIHINSDGYVYLTDSGISTSVKDRNGNAGNIGLHPKFLLLDNSRIIAKAVSGDGGNIDIPTTGIYHFSEEPLKEAINASSIFGRDGVVTLDSPVSNGLESLVFSPAGFINAEELRQNRCSVDGSQAVGRFIVNPYVGGLVLPNNW